MNEAIYTSFKAININQGFNCFLINVIDLNQCKMYLEKVIFYYFYENIMLYS